MVYRFFSVDSYQKVRHALQPHYQKVARHPFFNALLDKALPEKEFEGFIEQDGLFVYECGAKLEKKIPILRDRMDDVSITNLLQYANDMKAWGSNMQYHYLGRKNPHPVIAYPNTQTYIMHLSPPHIPCVARFLGLQLACPIIYHEILRPTLLNSILDLNHPQHLFLDSVMDPIFSVHAQNIQHMIRVHCQHLLPEHQRLVIEGARQSAQFEYQFINRFYPEPLVCSVPTL